MLGVRAVGTRQMPVLAFLAVVGFVLIALLFVADATLEKGSPAIVTSDRIGLPESRHPDTIQTLTTTSAPAPDMTSPAVLAAQPKSELEPPKNSHGTRSIYYRHNRLRDRFSIKTQYDPLSPPLQALQASGAGFLRSVSSCVGDETSRCR